MPHGEYAMSGNSVNSVTLRSGFSRLAIVAAAVPAPPPPMTISRSLMCPPWIGIRFRVATPQVFDTQHSRRALARSGSSGTSARADDDRRP